MSPGSEGDHHLEGHDEFFALESPGCSPQNALYAMMEQWKENLLRELPSRNTLVVTDGADGPAPEPATDGRASAESATAVSLPRARPIHTRSSVKRVTVAEDESEEDHLDENEALDEMGEMGTEIDSAAEEELLRMAVGPLSVRRRMRQILRNRDLGVEIVTGRGDRGGKRRHTRKARKPPLGRRMALFVGEKLTTGFRWLTDWNLWNRELHMIAGKHGSGVAALFSFIKLLFLLHGAMSVLIIGFLVFPQCLVNWNPFSAKEPAVNATLAEIVSKGFYYRIDPRKKAPRETFSIWDLLFGDGWLYQSVLYYGDYSENLLNLWGNLQYNMPLAYLFSVGFALVLAIIVIGRVAALSYRRHFILAEGEMKSRLVSSIFSGWDFSIVFKEAAELRQRGIYHEMREYLQNLTRPILVWDLATFAIIGGNFLFIIGSTALTLLVAAPTVYVPAGALPYLEEVGRSNVILGFVLPIVLPVFICHVAMWFFVFLPKVGATSSRGAKAGSLGMRFFLSCTLLIALLTCIMVPFLQRSPRTFEDHRDNLEVCWESELGSMFYRLFFWDSLISILIVPLVRIVWNISISHRDAHHQVAPTSEVLGDRVKEEVPSADKSQVHHLRLFFGGYPIAVELLSLLYSHTLIMLGVFFAPLLIVFSALRFGLMFHVKKQTIYGKCDLRGAHIEPLFLSWAFVLTFLTSIFFFYTQVNIETSSVCGPFQNVKLVADFLLTLSSESFLLDIFGLLRRGGVKFAFCCALLAGIYFLHYVARAHGEIADVLRSQLELQRLDKKFLLSRITAVMRSKGITRTEDFRRQRKSSMNHFLVNASHLLDNGSSLQDQTTTTSGLSSPQRELSLISDDGIRTSSPFTEARNPATSVVVSENYRSSTPVRGSRTEEVIEMCHRQSFTSTSESGASAFENPQGRRFEKRNGPKNQTNR